MKLPLVIALLASCHATYAAVNLPYANDFGSSASDFTAGGTGTWSVGSGRYTNNIPTDAPSYSVAQVTGLGGATKQSFSISTVISAASGSSTSVGFAVLSSGSNVNTSTFILADLFNNGTLRFRPFSAGSPTGTDISLASPVRFLEISTLGAVSLSVTGIYNSDDSLTLTLSATQGSTTTNHSTTFASGSVPTGEFFGFRNRNNTGSTNVTPYSVSFDSVAINAVPEPSVALFAIGFIGLAGLRRRR